jgi:hypothetical protein
VCLPAIPTLGPLEMEERPVVDYEASIPGAQRLPTSLRWYVPLLTGAVAGWLLSFAASGWWCCGPVVGFGVAALSAAFAQRHRLAFGFLGNGVTIVVCLLSAVVNNWRSGIAFSPDELRFTVLVLSIFVFIPGLIGIALVHRVLTPRDS